MVSELRPQGAVHWVTGSSAPCLSLFKPVLLDVGLPPQGAEPTDKAETSSHWWRHERFHRRALEDFPTTLAAIAQERDALERTFLARIDGVLDAPAADKRNAVDWCWRAAVMAEARWIRELHERPRRPRQAPLHRSWARLNRVAGFSL